MDSSKYKSCKIKLQNKEIKQYDIVEALKIYDSTSHLEGETLSDSARDYRVKVVTAFLKVGVSLSNIDSFCDILEEHAFSLSGRQHLSELILFILRQEKARKKEEISGRQLSVIFDGTTHVEEATAIDFRYDGRLQHQTTIGNHQASKEKHDRGRVELARLLITTLSTSLGIE